MFQNQMNPFRVGIPQISPGINWVNSVQEVEQIELPPGGMAVFFDKVTDGMMYIRTRDSYNIYNTRTFTYSEIQPKQPDSQYVTRNELEEMFKRFFGGMNNDTVSANDGAATAKSAGHKADDAGPAVLK